MLFSIGSKVLIKPLGITGVVLNITSFCEEYEEYEEYEERQDNENVRTVNEYYVEYKRLEPLHDNIFSTLDDDDDNLFEGESLSIRKGWWPEKDLKKFEKRTSGFSKFIKKLEL